MLSLLGIGLKAQLKAGHVWQVQTQKKALPFYNKVPTKRFPKRFCLNIHHSICIQPLSLVKLTFLGHLTRIRCTTSRPTIFLEHLRCRMMRPANVIHQVDKLWLGFGVRQQSSEFSARFMNVIWFSAKRQTCWINRMKPTFWEICLRYED